MFVRAGVIWILFFSVSLGAQDAATDELVSRAENALRKGDREQAAAHLRKARESALGSATGRRALERINTLLEENDPFHEHRAASVARAAEALIEIADHYAKQAWFTTAAELLTAASLMDPRAAAKPLRDIEAKLEKPRGPARRGLRPRTPTCQDELADGERELLAGSKERAAAHFRAAQRLADRMPADRTRRALERRISRMLRKADPSFLKRTRALKKAATGLISTARKYQRVHWYATALELLNMASAADPALADDPLGELVGQFREWRLTDARGVMSAVESGLDWLARHQVPREGYWDCDGFTKQCPRKPCHGPGYPLYDPGVTGLAVLAFLGAGHTHQAGEYKEVVGRAIQYLLRIQSPEGCFGTKVGHFIYPHCIATLALADAYRLTESSMLRGPVEKGADFICRAQTRSEQDGRRVAWRYTARSKDNDTSVTGWAIGALIASKAAGVSVPSEVFEGARTWITDMIDPDTGRIGYLQRGVSPVRAPEREEKWPRSKSEAITASGIVSLILMGDDTRDEMIQAGTRLMLDRLPTWNPETGDIDMYYWYLGTHALSLTGGSAWERWRKAIRKVFIQNQHVLGCRAGSLDPIGPWGEDGGRVYSTAFMVLGLERLLEGAK